MSRKYVAIAATCLYNAGPQSTGDLRRAITVAAKLKNAPVAQLDRVLGYEPSGREFESLRARQLFEVRSSS